MSSVREFPIRVHGISPTTHAELQMLTDQRKNANFCRVRHAFCFITGDLCYFQSIHYSSTVQKSGNKRHKVRCVSGCAGISRRSTNFSPPAHTFAEILQNNCKYFTYTCRQDNEKRNKAIKIWREMKRKTN